MTDVAITLPGGAESTEIAELRARLARLEQTANTNQGGTYPHTAILAGHPPYSVLGPVGDDGRVLPGAWNTATGLWEDPDTAEANRQAAAKAHAAEVAAARAAIEEANKARAMEVARAQLAEEEAFSAAVEQAKASLRDKPAETPAETP